MVLPAHRVPADGLNRYDNIADEIAVQGTGGLEPPSVRRQASGNPGQQKQYYGLHLRKIAIRQPSVLYWRDPPVAKNAICNSGFRYCQY